MSDFEAPKEQIFQRCGKCGTAWTFDVDVSRLVKVTVTGFDFEPPMAAGWGLCCGDRFAFRERRLS